MGWKDIRDNSKTLSVTKLRMLKRCPVQFEFRYVKGKIIPPNSALILGISTHQTVGANFQQKIKSKKDYKLPRLLDIFSDAWEKEKIRCEFKKGEKSGQVKDRGIDIIGCHHKKISSKIQPIAVEQEFNVDLFEGYKLWGFVDLIDTKRYLADFKTSWQKYSDEQALREKHIQLDPYFWACNKSKQIRIHPKKVRLDIIVKSKASPARALQFPFLVTKADITRFQASVHQAVQILERGLFIPRDDYRICSWCGYNKLCKTWH